MKNTLKPLPSLSSDTPRTDDVLHNVAELAMHARKLERENAELMKDKERLDWLLTTQSFMAMHLLGTCKDIDEAMEVNQ